MPTRVVVFGSGDCGQLGLGEDITELDRAKYIPFFNDKNIVSISAGGLHNLALARDGTLYSWGCNDEKALGHEYAEWQIGIVNLPLLANEKIIKVACGDSISAAITSEGNVFSWGTFRDSQGVLGFSPTNTQLQSTPIRLDTNNLKVVDIAAGANHLVAIANDTRDVLISWGSGEQGQLGRRILTRHKVNGLRPVIITPKKRPYQYHFPQIACGSYHSMAIASSLATSQSTLLTWGLNNYGQLGRDESDPQLLPSPTVNFNGGCNLVGISAGEHHSIALLEDGRVFSWGRGDFGQLGIAGDCLPSTSCIPQQIDFSNIPISKIASGSNHNLAVDINNNVYSWGFGSMGQLGNYSDQDRHIPELVKLPNIITSMPEFSVLQIQAGGQHSILLVGHQ